MFSFIVFVVIIIIVYRMRSANINRKFDNTNNNRQDQTIQKPVPPSTMPQNTARQKPVSTTGGSFHQSVSARNHSAQGTVPKSNYGVGTQTIRKPQAESVEQEEEQSTMEYLAEKAEMNSEDASQNRTVTNGRIGNRMPDWGEIGRNEVICICKNCGAENVLPRGAVRNSYACYFCREKL